MVLQQATNPCVSFPNLLDISFGNLGILSFLQLIKSRCMISHDCTMYRGQRMTLYHWKNPWKLMDSRYPNVILAPRIVRRQWGRV